MNKFKSFSLLYIFICNFFTAHTDETKSGTGQHLVHTGISTFSEDYGVEGRSDVVTLTLLRGMQPGSILSYVARADNNGTLSMHDTQDKVLLKMDLWFEDNILHLDSDIGEEMGDNLPNPVTRCAKTNTIIVNQTDGYRIFVNGKQVAFVRHRSSNPVKYINFAFDKLLKIYYLTTETIIKNV